MTGYVPLFDSLTTGTLCGKWPDIGLWPIILALADKHGVLDMTTAYIAGVTGLDIAEVKACMARFCEPDPGSRSGAEEGRRLLLLEPERRDWGWRVVNHGQYREKARKMAFDAQRTSNGSNAERMASRRRPAMTRDDPRKLDATRDDPPSDADSNADTDSEKNSSGEKTPRRSARARRCPPDFPLDIVFAETQIADLNAEAEAARFRDYEFKSPRSDWSATWRNWIRTCKDTGKYAKKNGSGWV